MITEQHRKDAASYAEALKDKLVEAGCRAEVTVPGSGLPMVCVGEHQFLVYFRTTDKKEHPLRVCWHTAESCFVNRPAGKNVASVAEDVTRDSRLHDEKCDFVLAEKKRVDAAHYEIERLRREYGLVEDEGSVRIEETDYRSGVFEVVFKTETPAEVEGVLKALRAAGMV